MAVNKFIGIGNLGRDPELKQLNDGTSVCNISIGITESYKDKATGEKKENTEWVNVSYFGKLADVVAQFTKKGSKVYVEGKLNTRKWTDANGIEKYTTSIRGEACEFLTPRSNDVGNAPQPQNSITDDDLPF